MAFFTSAITTLQTLVVALGAGLGVWGVVNLLEGYGSDNPGSKSQGIVLQLYSLGSELSIARDWPARTQGKYIVTGCVPIAMCTPPFYCLPQSLSVSGAHSHPL